MLDEELEWKEYEFPENVSQAEYNDLCQSGKYMSDDEAKELLYDWYGFAKEKIVVVRSASTYRKDRHNRIHKIGTADRRPLYCATDWHYIRFDVCENSYELFNDSLRHFMQ